MRLGKDDRDSFPRLHSYVKDSMPTCMHVSTIVKNLMKYAGLTEEEVRHALRWGTDPLVVIKDMWDDTAWKSTGNGGFDPAKPNQIDLAQHRVDQFELGPDFGFDKTKAGKNVYVVGATLLHEMCHWGCFKHGITEKGDHGKKFEVATYGRDVG